jgi:hypothetical protein
MDTIAPCAADTAAAPLLRHDPEGARAHWARILAHDTIDELDAAILEIEHGFAAAEAVIARGPQAVRAEIRRMDATLALRRVYWRQSGHRHHAARRPVLTAGRRGDRRLRSGRPAPRRRARASAPGPDDDPDHDRDRDHDRDHDLRGDDDLLGRGLRGRSA